jgi:lysozyme
MDIDKVKAQLILDEGEKLTAYWDTTGNLTIGIGHLIIPSDKIGVGQTISQEQCDALFAADLQTAIDTCVKAPFVPYVKQPEAIQEVLVQICFNEGIYRLEEFVTFLTLLHNHNYSAAANDLEQTLYARQVPDRVSRYAADIRQCQGM